MSDLSDTTFGSESDLVHEMDWTIEAGIRCLAGIVKGLTGNDPLSEQEFTNDTFAIRPYDWSEPDDEDLDDPENWPESKPNFEYDMEAFECEWYKHLGRASKQNKILTPKQMAEMFSDCFQSLKEYGNRSEETK